MVAAVTTTPNPKVSTHQNPKRPPLSISEVNNGPRRPKSREVSSRYLSSASSTSTSSSSATSSSFSSSSNSSSSRRCSSPLTARAVPTTPMPNPTAKRAQSAERRRSVTPRPTASAEMSNAAKLLVTSTRRLSVSFQGESYSLPISKEKPAPAVMNSIRKATPERRKVATPVRDQTENSKPTDQQRWPARSRLVNNSSRSVDFTTERMELGGSGSVVRALQQSMIDESRGPTRLIPERHNAPLEKQFQLVVNPNSPTGSVVTSDLAASDTESVSSGSTSSVQEYGSVAQVRGSPHGVILPARFWHEASNRLRQVPEPASPTLKSNGLKTAVLPKSIGTKKFLNDSPMSSPRGGVASRGLSSPLRGGVRPASPSKLMTSSTSSPSRGMPSPTRMRNGIANTVSNNPGSTSSILSFAADLRRGKMAENRIVDAHVLRLQYNRYLQWRFVNARADASLVVQRATAEKSLYNAWVTTSKLQLSVKSKRVELQLLRHNLKLYSILNGQMLYLDDWDQIDRDNTSSLSGATDALEASTLRLPIVGGARADVQNMKDAICSAIDVMQAMASSICSFQIKVEQLNSMVSEVARVIAEECALLDRCKELLSRLTAIQVKDCSLRTHVLQLKRLPQA